MAKSNARRNVQQQAAADFDTLFGARQGERSISGGFKMLAHDRITVRPQVRRSFPKADMDELRASIRELRSQQGGIEGTGLLQALLVSPDEGGYRLIAGERRYRAARDEGLPEVPCVVVPAVSDSMTRLLQLTENSQRSAPPVLEEAQALRATMDEQKLSLRDMARLLGKTKGYVENRLNLLKMGDDVREMVSSREDTLRVAAHIEKVKDAELRAQLVRAVVDEEIGEREVLRRIESAFSPLQQEPSDDLASDTGDEPDTTPSSGSQDRLKGQEEAKQVSSREDTSGEATSGGARGNTSGSDISGAGSSPVLSNAVRATAQAVETLRRAQSERRLSRRDRDRERAQVAALRAFIRELDEVLG